MANNMCSMCGGSSSSMSRGAPQHSNSGGGGQMPCIQMCLPTLAGKPPPSTGHHAPGQQPSIIQVPCEAAKPCPKFVCEPCPPPPPTKVWLIKSSPVPQKFRYCTAASLSSNMHSPHYYTVSAPLHVKYVRTAESVCLPVGDSSNQECPVTKLLVCLPCPPPINFPQEGKPQKCEDGERSKKKPGAKYLPPPEKKICSPNCIHVDDIKPVRPCTWHQNIPCPADCFNTPLTKN